MKPRRYRPSGGKHAGLRPQPVAATHLLRFTKNRWDAICVGTQPVLQCGATPAAGRLTPRNNLPSGRQKQFAVAGAHPCGTD